MKKSLIIFLFLALCFINNQYSQKAFSAELTLSEISSIENSLFNQSYNDSSIQTRLAKIETIIYGQTFDKLSVDERMQKLRAFVPKDTSNSKRSQTDNQKDLASIPPNNTDNNKQPSNDMRDWISSLPKDSNTDSNADYLEGTLPPRENTMFTEESKNNNPPATPQNEFQDDLYNSSSEQQQENPDNSTYPSIDQAEHEIFGKSFANENIYKRLDRLELKLNGKIQHSSLYDRVNNIQNQTNSIAIKQKYAQQFTPVNPSVTEQTIPHSNSYYKYFDDRTNKSSDTNLQGNSGSSNNYNIPASNTQTGSFGVMGSKLSQLEQQVFGKTFDDDLSMNRVDRLEKRVLGKTSFGLLNERLEKITAMASGRPMNSASTVSKGYYFTEDGYERDNKSETAQNGQPPKQFMFGSSMGGNYSGEYSQSPYDTMQNSYSTNNYATNNYNPNLSTLNQLEMQVFGRAYANMDTSVRLNRLENSMLGQVNGGDMNLRLGRLQQMMQNGYYGANNYGYNNGYSNYNTNMSGYGSPYNNGYNAYNQYYSPYGYGAGMPMTPRSLAGAAVGSAVQGALGNKKGILAQIGKVAGSAMFGNPMYNNYYSGMPGGVPYQYGY